MSGTTELQRELGSIELLLRKIDSSADPSLRSTVLELVELVMKLHGAGLERILEVIQCTRDPGEVVKKLGDDELVSNLLILHGLHPLEFEARVTRAVDKARSRLRGHGAELEVVSIQDGVVRLRLNGKSQGCGSTAQSLKEVVEEAVYEAAPDLNTLTIEGAEDNQNFVPLEMLQGSKPALVATNGFSLRQGGKGL